MATPEHLDGRHRDTLRQIFAHPTSHNIEWRSVVDLLETVGTVTVRHDGKVSVKLGNELEFLDPPAGKDIDKTKWDFDIGNGFYNYDANMWISGWGNNELQYYTREPGNAFVKDGMLHIRVLSPSKGRSTIQQPATGPGTSPDQSTCAESAACRRLPRYLSHPSWHCLRPSARCRAYAST